MINTSTAESIVERWSVSNVVCNRDMKLRISSLGIGEQPVSKP
jgi:hypothetical protein